MAIVIENKYEWGDTVYLKTDADQLPRIVIAITVYKQGEIVYKMVCGTIESNHYDFELSDTKNVLVNS